MTRNKKNILKKATLAKKLRIVILGQISSFIFLAVVAQNPVLPDLIDNTRHYDNVSSSMEVDEFLSSTEKSIDEQVIKKSLTEQSFDMATLQSYFGEKYFTERLVADKDLWKELKQG